MSDKAESGTHDAWRDVQYRNADINDKLIINLRDLGHMLRSLYEGKGSQKRIVIVLNEIGGSITQRELTERLGIQPGSASEVIAKLESSGHIRRTPNETDRRTADIELTEAGKTFAEEAKEQRLRRHEQMFSCLSDAEKDELLSLLERVNSDWETRYQNIRDNRRQGGHQRREHGSNGKLYRQGRE